MNRYLVKLAGFSFTKHVGPDGKTHMSPVHTPERKVDGKLVPAYDTHAVVAEELEVEAHDETHAEAVFRKQLGIIGTRREFTVQLLGADGKPSAESDEDDRDDEGEDDDAELGGAEPIDALLGAGGDELVTAESAPKGRKKK
jgi:hypothetical protein